jgi:hypothetical protein
MKQLYRSNEIQFDSSRNSRHVQIVTDHAAWDGFLTKQPNGHLHQAYEWGELLSSLGNTVIRLGAFEQNKLVGTMMLFHCRCAAACLAPYPLS